LVPQEITPSMLLMGGATNPKAFNGMGRVKINL
jgi:hypothetical protein